MKHGNDFFAKIIPGNKNAIITAPTEDDFWEMNAFYKEHTGHNLYKDPNMVNAFAWREYKENFCVQIDADCASFSPRVFYVDNFKEYANNVDNRFNFCDVQTFIMLCGGQNPMPILDDEAITCLL